MKDLRSAHARAMVFIEKWIQKNFEQEGALAMEGAKWKPLKPSTIARRRHGRNAAHAGEVKILRDRGWLKNKWKPYYSAHKIAYQSMMDYGVYHDSDKPRHRLPQRRIIPRQRQVRGDIRRIYLKHIGEVIKGRA